MLKGEQKFAFCLCKIIKNKNLHKLSAKIKNSSSNFKKTSFSFN